MKVRIKKRLITEEGEALNLTIREKIKLIARLNEKIGELERKLRELDMEISQNDHIDEWPELLDACSHLKNSVTGKRTAKKASK